MEESAAPSEPSIRFGAYELTRLIGQGGMAEVYEAHRLSKHGVRTRVAIKRILPHLSGQRDQLRMFIREAELCGQLNHPNVVQIQEFDEVDGHYYLAMEYVDGCDLDRLLELLIARGETLPATVVFELMSQILTGLAYAHRARGFDGNGMDLIHRDLKPSNLLISRSGLVKIGDFGVARAKSSFMSSQTNGHIKGTLRYMAPEQVCLEPLSQSIDLYSVGVMLYEMLTMEPLIPVKASLTAIIKAIDQLNVAEVLKRVPAGLEPFKLLLELLLQRQPFQRYGSAQEALDDLYASQRLLPPGPSLANYMAPLWDDLQVSSSSNRVH